MAGIMAEVHSKIGDGSSLIGADGDAIAAQAANHLASCVNDAISNALFGNEMAAVGFATPGGVTKCGNGIYEIGVNIPAQFRPSLMPEIYGGVDDMAALFNNGYVANQLTVYYPNTNEVKKSRPARLPAQFVQTGLAVFQVSGGGDYQVISVQPSGRFGG